ncbi:hypothetical protein VTL71DRAFT_9098 [Oculimacula yallundae]|uniref:Uncharacterized protein n=1 Tax=Oculimacula yallundae TaxID=86028 RepID=A0ABR4BTT5_9HELO
MQFPSTFTALAAVLSLTVGTYAWTQDRNGVWTASNNYYTINGRMYRQHNCGSKLMIIAVRVHEACTFQNTIKIHNDGDSCAYFTNDRGKIFHGRCVWFKLANGAQTSVSCITLVRPNSEVVGGTGHLDKGFD